MTWLAIRCDDLCSLYKRGTHVIDIDGANRLIASCRVQRHSAPDRTHEICNQLRALVERPENIKENERHGTNLLVNSEPCQDVLKCLFRRRIQGVRGVRSCGVELPKRPCIDQRT